MKPITEEQRQALIADCNEQIEIIKDLIFNGSYAEGNYNLESQLLVQEIALASLTAEPVAKTEVSGCVWVNDGGSSLKPPVSTPLYTAPTVPMIDLPKYKSKIAADCTADVYFQGKGDGWNECIAEIKRLNGLEKS